MVKLAEWMRQLWYLLNRKRFDEALRLEMEAHRESMAQPKRFGNSLHLRERSRDVWGLTWLDDWRRDFRLAGRQMLHAPGFALTVIVTLTLGIVLATSTFAVVNAYLIRALPYPESDRLYHVLYAPQGRPEPRGISRIDFRELADVVELADSSQLTRLLVYDGAAGRDVQGLMVSEGSLEMLGVRVVAGRSLEPADFQAGAEQVALVDRDWWKTRFGETGSIVGQTFRANRINIAEPEETYRVAGMLPPEFRYARELRRGPVPIVVALRVPAQSYFVRLQRGVPVEAAEKRLTEAAKRVATSIPEQWSGVRLEAARERYAGEVRPMLTAMGSAAGIVLLTVCVNIAVLMLLRSMRREKEVAVRHALGAGRSQILRMVAAEALLLCGSALAVGLIISSQVLRWLAPTIEAHLGLLAPGGAESIGLDGTVLAAAAGCSVLIAVLLSFAPLVTQQQDRIAESIQAGGRGGTGSESSRWVRYTLVTVEVGASLALLAGSGLMIRTVMNLVGTDLGMDMANIVRARVALPMRTYPEAATFGPFYERLTDRLSSERTPFALANFILLYDAPRQTMEVEGAAAQRAGLLAISDGFIGLFGMKVVAGRGFDAGDRSGSEPVAIISESLARQTWPNSAAVGKRIRTADQPIPNSPLTVWRTVVGVVRDVRQTHTDLDLNDIYIPFAQAPSRYAQLFLKTGQPVVEWKNVDAMAAAIDPQVQISSDFPARTALQNEVSKLLAGPRFLMSSLTGFAAFALLLSVLGIYGVAAFAAHQREKEVAIRMAVGASRADIVRLFLRESSLVLGVGVLIGSAGAAAVAGLLRTQVFGVQPFEISAFAGPALLVLGAGLIATLLPARRAAGKNPVRALNGV